MIELKCKMSKTIRLIITGLFSLLFLLATPLVVLRAQGFDFNFDQNQIVRQGKILLKPKPKKASIYLNDKILKKQTPRLISDLKPGFYPVKVQKPGYHPWQKNLKVEPFLVNKQISILLLPKNPQFKKVPLEKIDLQDQTTTNQLNSGLITTDHAIFLQEKEVNKRPRLITRYLSPIKKAVLFHDGQHIIFQVGSKIKFIETDGTNCLDFIEAKGFIYNSQENKLFVKRKKNWFKVKAEDIFN